MVSNSYLKSLKITNHNLLVCLLFYAFIALAAAYVSQYFFDLQPCILCLYQRKPFFAIIALTFIALTFFKTEKLKRVAVFLCALLLLINAAIAIYHVGVEKKIFRGPTTCSSSQNLNEITNIENLRIALSNTKAIRCDEPTFVFIGISMAGWNIIYCLGLFFVTMFLAVKNNKKDQQEKN